MPMPSAARVCVVGAAGVLALSVAGGLARWAAGGSGPTRSPGTSRRRPRFATRAATCMRPRSPASNHSSEHDMPVPIFPIPMWEEDLTLFGVIMAGVIMVCAGALAYFRRVRMDRPPVGTFNGRDVAILLTFIGVLPFI